MANPTYNPQGVTTIHPLNVTTGFTITNGSATINDGGLALNSNSVSPATSEFEFPLPGSPVNGNNYIFIIKVYNNTNQVIDNGRIRFKDNSGNWTFINIFASNGWRRGEIFLRLYIPSLPFTPDLGFDVTNLTDLELQLDINDTDESDVYVVRRLDMFDMSPVILTGGSSGDPFTLDTILSTFNNDFWDFDHEADPLWRKTYPRQAAPTLELDAPIQIGNGTSGSTFFELGALQGWSLSNAVQNRIPFRGDTGSNDYAELLGFLPSQGRKLHINLGDEQSFPPSVVYDCEFKDLSPAQLTFNSWLFLRTSPEFSAESVINSCSLIDNQTSVDGGKTFNDTGFVSSVATNTINWNGAATFNGCRIDSPNSDYGFNFDGANFADGATFDASSITFVTEPSVKKFRLDATGKTLNLNVGTTGFTTADVEVVAGTLNVVATQISITLSGLVTGSRVYIRDTTAGADLFNEIEATASFSGVVGNAGNSLLIRVANASGTPKYKRYQTSVVIPSNDFEIPVNQELDE